MLIIAEIALWIVTIPLCLALLVFAGECFLGLAPITTNRAALKDTCAIVVPAHNEEATIGYSLGLLLGSIPEGARVIVVADNCSDRTSEIARTHPCEVIVRNDPLRLGKGFALAHAAEHLEADPPQVVIVLDADSTISPGGVEALVSQVLASRNAAQAINLQFDFSNAGELVGISNFALLVKNLIRCRGLERLSGSSSLFGTGMALPWSCFRAEILASENIVDDLALTIDLAREGVFCHLVEQARVTSGSTVWTETVTQRTRWEHGYIVTGMGQALPILVLAVTKRSRRLFFLAVDLLVPPLALLVLLSVLALTLALAWAAVSGQWLPAALLTAGLGISGLAVFAAWYVEGRKILRWQSLLWTPVYVLSKLPIYLGVLTSRKIGWTRTRRNGEHPE